MDLRLFVLLVITVATWSAVLGQSAFGPSSCANLATLPTFTGTVVGGPASYSLASSMTTYSPGDAAVQVFVFSQVGQTQFSSIILQARRLDNGAVVGSFNIDSNPGLEFLDCGDFGEATVISSGQAVMNLPLVVLWNPPPVSYGNLQFVATIVDTASNIYENIESFSDITANVALVPLTITACPVPIINNLIVTYTAPTCQRGNTPFGDAVCNLPSGSPNFVVGPNTVDCSCLDAGDTASCDFTFVLPPVVGPCNPNPCQNGGRCTDLGGGAFVCSCINSFTGTICDQAPPPRGDCMPNPCVGGAECRVAGATEAGYTCHSTVGVPCQ